jgi:excisionase family DNA binding protein
MGPESTETRTNHRRIEDGAYMRTAEVAKILHVSPKTVSRWAQEDKLPYVKTLGGHRRFPSRAIRELAASLAEDMR